MIDLKPACRGMIDVLGQVADEQLDHSTPCTDFTVADLIEHISQVSQGFASVAQKNVVDAEPVLPTRPLRTAERARVATYVRLLGEVWDDPDGWQGSTDAGGLELPNELWGKIALTEMVVHGWDLARATGRSLHVPDSTLRACYEHVVEFVPRAPVPELWGQPVAVRDEATLLDRIVAVTGRTP